MIGPFDVATRIDYPSGTPMSAVTPHTIEWDPQSPVLVERGNPDPSADPRPA
jgi:hypothetical protein